MKLSVERLRTGIARLRQIDWDLRKAWTAGDLHELHWYPATFPPQLPRLLVSLFSEPGAVVLDPFAGCGTTVVQAIKAKRYGVGIEVNPIGHLIASAKLKPDAPAKIASKLGELRIELRAAWPIETLRSATRPSPVGYDARWDEVRRWYHADTYAELQWLWTWCQSHETDLAPILTCLFSSVLKSASAQREHWGYVADNMRPRRVPYRPAAMLFLSAMVRAEREFALHAEALSPWPVFQQFVERSRLLNSDVRTAEVAAESIDLVVTSPPYAGITDYARAHRLSFDWLGWDMGATEQAEIGARWKRRRRTAVEHYVAEMGSLPGRLASWMRTGALCIYVIGQSRSRDIDDRVSRELMVQMNVAGLRLVAEPLARSRENQRVVNRRGQPSDEAIYVFQKS